VGREEGSSFSEEKEAKRLHLFAVRATRFLRLKSLQPIAQIKESFLVLFFKKERASLPSELSGA
jgi:hypothetical protein